MPAQRAHLDILACIERFAGRDTAARYISARASRLDGQVDQAAKISRRRLFDEIFDDQNIVSINRAFRTENPGVSDARLLGRREIARPSEHGDHSSDIAHAWTTIAVDRPLPNIGAFDAAVLVRDSVGLEANLWKNEGEPVLLAEIGATDLRVVEFSNVHPRMPSTQTGQDLHDVLESGVAVADLYFENAGHLVAARRILMPFQGVDDQGSTITLVLSVFIPGVFSTRATY